MTSFFQGGQNKKAELTAGSFFGSSAIFDFIRPAAFRPILTGGLALSGVKQKASEKVSEPPGGLAWHPLESCPHDSLQKVRG